MSIIGSIIGDIIGSQYEFNMPSDYNPETAPLFSDNCVFTDDTVMTIATKAAIIRGEPFAKVYQEFGRKYPNAGYGNLFYGWIFDEDPKPYGSFGNGSAMRVSYIADHYDKKIEVMYKAAESAMCSHDHPEGIKGAIVTAACAYMAKQGASKEDILTFSNRSYPLSEYTFSSERSLDDIRDIYTWDGTCQGSVPVAIRCIYEANSYIEFIRNVFSLNCDMDTICAIGGSIAEELFGGTGLNNDVILKKYLPEKLLNIVYQEK